jgi:hypothetical protein
VIEWDRAAHRRHMRTTLDLAVELYDRGATEVRIAESVVRMPERLQTYRGQR